MDILWGMRVNRDIVAPHPANRLGLDFRQEATRLPWTQPIWDVHTHLHDLEAARLFFQVADVFGVERVWTMSPLEEVDAITDSFGDRVEFIAVPNYKQAKERSDTFTTDWLKRIEGFAQKGCRICKFWMAPRGRDVDPALRMDSPIRRQSMELARSLGMMFMTHVADPDTWFATHYRDQDRYGTKAQHHEAFERLLEEFSDVPWLAAHMAGDPEDLDHVQGLLDRHPNLCVDTAATKWMVRELSKAPDKLREFCRRNPGRVLFGSDIVADQSDATFDLLASRYWAMRALFETDYNGPSPIEDPDLRLVDPGLSPEVLATLRGAKLDTPTLQSVYRTAAKEQMPNAADPG
jgi:hypothetical protein